MKEGIVGVVESKVFVQPWTETQDLLIIRGASGGGDGAFLLEGLNLFDTTSGSVGKEGEGTNLEHRDAGYRAVGGIGGGGGGWFQEGKPINGLHSWGCHYDGGGDGEGATVAPADGRITASGGNDSKGFLGEIQIHRLINLSLNDKFEIKIGKGGNGGIGGKGYKTGKSSDKGNNGFVLLVPVFATKGISSAI